MTLTNTINVGESKLKQSFTTKSSSGSNVKNFQLFPLVSIRKELVHFFLHVVELFGVANVIHVLVIL